VFADYVYIITKNAPAALAKHNFGRAYMYLSPQRNDTTWASSSAARRDFQSRPTCPSPITHGLAIRFHQAVGSPGGEVQAQPKGDIPVMKWSCLEWEFNDDPDQINVWGDGKVIGSLNNTTVAYPPARPQARRSSTTWTAASSARSPTSASVSTTGTPRIGQHSIFTTTT